MTAVLTVPPAAAAPAATFVVPGRDTAGLRTGGSGPLPFTLTGWVPGLLGCGFTACVPGLGFTMVLPGRDGTGLCGLTIVLPGRDGTGDLAFTVVVPGREPVGLAPVLVGAACSNRDLRVRREDAR